MLLVYQSSKAEVVPDGLYGGPSKHPRPTKPPPTARPHVRAAVETSYGGNHRLQQGGARGSYNAGMMG